MKKVKIARKRNMKDVAHPLSMGFGFVEFTSPHLSQQALSRSSGDTCKLELKISNSDANW